MPTHRRGLVPLGIVAGALALSLAFPAASNAAGPAVKPPAKPAEMPLSDRSVIAAVVNGDVISNGDIANRARLFAISTGMGLSPEVIERLRPQILKQLIDEKLRVQEAQRRKIVISDAQIAAAIKEIETRNGMPPGALRSKLAADGVSTRTLIDQIRAQLGWQQVLRDASRDQTNLVVSDAEVAAQQALLAAQVGQTEYRVGEIFIPVDDPSNPSEAEKFAETVITQLRAGAPFPIVAAQFSQTQSALEGGQLGWIELNQLDPAEARVVSEMPTGAISNPVRVPGGFAIVTLEGKRQLGNEMATVVSVRQAFFPFDKPLDPAAPTEQQREQLAKAKSAAATIKSCDEMESFAKRNNPPSRPADPGEINVAGVNPPNFRQLLQTIPIGKVTEPLVSRDGIAILTVCTRGEKNLGVMTKAQVQAELVNERVEMLSRTLMHELHRRATIDIRNNPA